MDADLFHLNRPVHLARRDVFYEQARQMIGHLSIHKDPADQYETAKQALALFQNALHHAKAANQSQEAEDGDLLFYDFLDAAVDNTQSITRMLRRQRAVESETSPVIRFLNSEDSGSKMAAHYRRCAAHILKGLLHILAQAEKPYQKLQQSTAEKAPPEERTRYEKARQYLLTLEHD